MVVKARRLASFSINIALQLLNDADVPRESKLWTEDLRAKLDVEE